MKPMIHRVQYYETDSSFNFPSFLANMCIGKLGFDLK